MQKSLVEYARNEISRNRIHKFLEGTNLQDFYFVGLHEHYNEDMEALAKKMGVSDYQIFQYNKTSKKESVPNEIIEEIRKLNSLDYLYYDEAKKIREQRIKEEDKLLFGWHLIPDQAIHSSGMYSMRYMDWNPAPSIWTLSILLMRLTTHTHL